MREPEIMSARSLRTTYAGVVIVYTPHVRERALNTVNRLGKTSESSSRTGGLPIVH